MAIVIAVRTDYLSIRVLLLGQVQLKYRLALFFTTGWERRKMARRPISPHRRGAMAILPRAFPVICSRRTRRFRDGRDFAGVADISSPPAKRHFVVLKSRFPKGAGALLGRDGQRKARPRWPHRHQHFQRPARGMVTATFGHRA